MTSEKERDRARDRQYVTNLLTQRDKTRDDIVAAKERVDANEK